MDLKNIIHIDSLKQLEQIKDIWGDFIDHLKECGLDEEETQGTSPYMSRFR